MDFDVKKLLDKLKEPALLCNFLPRKHSSPNLLSHAGGLPYLEKKDKNPRCGLCAHALEFIFQLFIPNGKINELYSFYYCFGCSETAGNKGFKILKHVNPDLRKAASKPKVKSPAHYCDFDFELEWSLPDWNTLLKLEPDFADLLIAVHNEETPMVYENIRDSLLGEEHEESYSVYGGYPNFLNDSAFPSCECCNKPMKQWIQLDSLEDVSLVWSDFGCLYVFRCSDDKHNFKILIQ